MTDNDWIKQLQSMMERHEEPVGDDLWQDIESRLPGQQAQRRVVPAWRRYAAAAAVALAVIGAGSLLWHGGNDKPTEKPEITSTMPEANAPESENLAQNDDITNPDIDATAINPQRANAAPVKKSPAALNANGQSDLIAQVTNPAEAITPQETNSNEPVKQIEEQTEQPVEKPAVGHINASPSSNSTAHTIVMPARKRRPVSLEFYASNAFKPQRSNGRDMADFYSGVFDYHLFGFTQLYDSIYSPVFKHKFGKHQAPYSFGLSVRVPLNDRLALTSGLVYTRLKSDFSSGSKEQILHYLGVPLGVTYTLWGYKRFSVYGIGGMQADFNVKATVRHSSTINSFNMSKDRVQFSALAGPGLQLDLTQDFGIYVEPTVRYYFNNGSDVENYFKDKPWNINLNAGLRLTL